MKLVRNITKEVSTFSYDLTTISNCCRVQKIFIETTKDATQHRGLQSIYKNNVCHAEVVEGVFTVSVFR